MEERREPSTAARDSAPRGRVGAGYQPPTCEVVSLDCEISAYAPDGDEIPLF